MSQSLIFFATSDCGLSQRSDLKGALNASWGVRRAVRSDHSGWTLISSLNSFTICHSQLFGILTALNIRVHVVFDWLSSAGKSVLIPVKA